MTTMIKRLGWVIIACVCTSIAAGARTAPLTEEPMPKAPTYRPPMPATPKMRVDGHVRGTDDAVLTLTVLAPEHVGLTTKEQPSLYWFQSKAVTTRFELTITEKKAIKPLLEARLEMSSGGVQRLRLSDYKISLVEGVEYRWSVAMVVDPENRSSDVVASGAIKRVKPTETLLQRLKAAPASDVPYIYADEGVWYDSLETLSELVDARPQDAKLHEIRAIYFMQVGLHDAAMHEMRLAGKTAESQAR
jgi:hypothetical protein